MSSGDAWKAGIDVIAIEPDRDLEDLTTFGVPARCRFHAAPGSVSELIDVLHWVRRKGLPWLILGEGSNVLFTGDYPGLVIRVRIDGIDFRAGDNGDVLVSAGAGVNWHTLVETCLAHGAHGLENLALIPGSVGAAPVQNIGAYGVELGDRLDHLEALDVETGEVVTMTAEECRFGYRDSIFKRSLAGSRIITGVVLRLSERPDPVVHYPALAARLREQHLEPSSANVFRAVCEIRRSKLPDPVLIGNAGSFFRNPVVPRSRHEALQEQFMSRFGELPGFPAGSHELVKLPAAWLIEKAGWKGYREGDAGVHDRQALVLVNHGHASGAQIARLAGRIADSVEALFGVRLEREVTVL
ncbi:MAG: UDP-N-acetylmuramate dehydrogenase [Pseudomonadota bacterium]